MYIRLSQILDRFGSETHEKISFLIATNLQQIHDTGVEEESPLPASETETRCFFRFKQLREFLAGKLW